MLVIETNNVKYDSPRLLAISIKAARVKGRLSHDNIAAKAGVSRLTVIRAEKPDRIGRCQLGIVLLILEALAMLGSPVEVYDHE
ncbi:hypothetical protein GXW78_18170 [Roseomonas terrae]|uniref:XRE family transcriptional regulator n=1 Tax=Neoroseomonas terrae TaxID=424799 RepID=A0ABS5EKP3_9PROT|nr:hypothetical protein [Neoroseomonas terrae]MBR0651602.1 hypothetical protein [Neoroseomonas terrae]